MKRNKQGTSFYGLGKRRRKVEPPTTQTKTEGDVTTREALKFFHCMFDPEKFDNRVPPIILPHQLYSVVNNKTQVDKDVSDMRERKEIKMFRLGNEGETCVVLTDDYKQYLRKNSHCPKNVTEKFIKTVVDCSTDVTFDRNAMREFNFQEKEITQLINGGLFTVRDIGSWWLAIPAIGIFMKCYRKGREGLLRSIRTSRFKEILLQELESRKLQAVQQLGMKYHIHDIMGSECVEKIQTTSGVLLRYDD